jgi:hypothetical protein
MRRAATSRRARSKTSESCCACVCVCSARSGAVTQVAHACRWAHCRAPPGPSTPRTPALLPRVRVSEGQPAHLCAAASAGAAKTWRRGWRSCAQEPPWPPACTRPPLRGALARAAAGAHAGMPPSGTSSACCSTGHGRFTSQLCNAPRLEQQPRFARDRWREVPATPTALHAVHARTVFTLSVLCAPEPANGHACHGR